MKRSALKPGTKGLTRGAPMKRGKPLESQGHRVLARLSASSDDPPVKNVRVGGLTKSRAPMKARSKTNAKTRPKTGEAELCRGRGCYVAIPGLCWNDVATVVPAHSNQARHGKGRGIKAHDEFTVPACFLCHAELDQGKRFTREEKFALWDAAFERWRHDRAVLVSMSRK